MYRIVIKPTSSTPKNKNLLETGSIETFSKGDTTCVLRYECRRYGTVPAMVLADLMLLEEKFKRLNNNHAFIYHQLLFRLFPSF